MADDFLNRVSRLLRSAVMRWFMLVYIVVVVGVLIFRFWPEVRNARGISKPDFVSDATVAIWKLQKQNDAVNKRLEEMSEELRRMETIPSDGPSDQELVLLRERVKMIDDDLQALKGALNPTNIDEVLTVARLGDKFEILQSQLSSLASESEALEASVDVRIQRGYDQLSAQIDRIVDMIKWFGLLLVPIILSTLRGVAKGKKSDEVG